jgi:hypothetical protein
VFRDGLYTMANAVPRGTIEDAVAHAAAIIAEVSAVKTKPPPSLARTHTLSHSPPPPLSLSHTHTHSFSLSLALQVLGTYMAHSHAGVLTMPHATQHTHTHTHTHTMLLLTRCWRRWMIEEWTRWQGTSLGTRKWPAGAGDGSIYGTGLIPNRSNRCQTVEGGCRRYTRA